MKTLISISYIKTKQRSYIYHFTLLSELRGGLAVCSAKGVPSFPSYFKTLSIGPASRIKPATSHSKVKRSTNWANLAAAQDGRRRILQVYLTFQ